MLPIIPDTLSLFTLLPEMRASSFSPVDLSRFKNKCVLLLPPGMPPAVFCLLSWEWKVKDSFGRREGRDHIDLWVSGWEETLKMGGIKSKENMEPWRQAAWGLLAWDTSNSWNLLWNHGGVSTSYQMVINPFQADALLAQVLPCGQG